jgi:hypothetical protein
MVGIINEEFSTVTTGSDTVIAENGHNENIGSVVEAKAEIESCLLEKPLSPKASTRFRQLLARPGIVVSLRVDNVINSVVDFSSLTHRLLLVFAMVSVPAVRWKPDLKSSTKGRQQLRN